MKRLRFLFVFVTVMGIEMACFGQEATISNVAFSQGPSGLGTQVDIYYTLTGATVAHAVTAQFSKDGGLTYPFAVTTATGDIGPGVFPGSNRHIVWNVAADYPGETITNAAIRVIADRPSAAGPYPIGYRNITYTDPARSNRSVATRIYYPATAAGQNTPVASGLFPVVVFGHGFVITIDSYPYVWNALVPQGYILVMVNTETGILPNHTNFARDLAFMADKMQSESTNAGSPFFGKVMDGTAVMGHSMGGGATVLSVQYSSNITTIIPMAAANTNPSAIAAAASITIPALMIAGAEDCVAPPAQHQIPMYQAMPSTCKHYAEIVGGSHCQFAHNSVLCNSAQGITCPFRTYISETLQQAIVTDLALPWLDARIKGKGSSWLVFEQTASDMATSGEITHEVDCAGTPVASSSTGLIETVRPSVTLVAVTDTSTINVGFSEGMLSPGVVTTSRYTVSGARGTLAEHPSSVTPLGGNAYRLEWASGEMQNGGVITVSVTDMQDIAGNPIDVPNSGQSVGVGVAPTGAVVINGGAAFAASADVTLALSASDIGSGVADMQFSNDAAIWSGWEPFSTAKNWTLADGDGTKNVYARYRDGAGNVSVGPIDDEIVLDTAPPTVTLDCTAPLVTNASISIVVSFTEPVIGFEADDINTFNATVQSFVGTGSGYTFTLVPETQGAFGCNVNADAATDAAGNVNPAISNTITRTFDSEPPAVTLSCTAPDAVNAPVAVIVLLTEDSTTFGIDDIATANAQVTDFSGSGSMYSFVLAPLGQGPFSCTVVAGSFADAASNLNVEASNSIALQFDSVPPTALIILTSHTPTSADTLPFFVSISEPLSAPLDDSNFVLSPGSLSGALQVTGYDTVYTVSVTILDPEADGTMGLSIVGAPADLAGNVLEAGFSPQYVVYNWKGFSTQPDSARLYTNDSHTLTVASNFGPIVPSFQWKWDDGTKTIQDGPTADTWVLSDLRPLNGGEYWCEVEFDGIIYPSDHATLEVANHVTITQAPVGAERQAGDSYVFAVVAEGGYAPLTYQWLKNDVPMPGATRQSLTLEMLSESDSGSYSVRVSDSNYDEAESGGAFLSVGGIELPGARRLGLVVLSILLATLGCQLFRRHRAG